MILRRTLLACAAGALAAPAIAQFIPSQESLQGFYTGTTYSPYAQREFPSQVFWGDTPVHTNISLDAGMFGNTLGPDEAYRFAKGEQSGLGGHRKWRAGGAHLSASCR
jgi:hypothetical protein